MSEPILANKWLSLVSKGKILWALTALSQNPLLLSESVRVVKVNVILAYFCLFYLPMAQRKMRHWLEIERRWQETEDIETAEEILAMGEEAEEVKYYLQYAR